MIYNHLSLVTIMRTPFGAEEDSVPDLLISYIIRFPILCSIKLVRIYQLKCKFYT